ncbi:MAG: DUF72 domain-containing protein [Polyangiales bacterium]
MNVLAGAVLERPPGPKYVSALRYAELALADPLPKASTLARWRKELPDGFELALRTPERAWMSAEGALRPGAELTQGLKWLANAVDALQPRLVVLPTQATITTGARDRDRLRAYMEQLRAIEGTKIVWRPRGLWEPDAVQRMANTLGVIGGFDGIDDPVPSSSTIYVSLQAEGMRRSFSHAQLLDLLDKITATDPDAAFVSIESAQSVREAQLLQGLVVGVP